jgi:hypothetical protein
MEHPTKINQVHCAYGPVFFKNFQKKYNLPRYTDITKPVLFYGCYYQRELERLLAHQSKCVVVWRGSDILWAMEHPEYMKELSKRNNIHHIAISNFIAEDLSKWDIPHKIIPIASMINTDIIPQPLGDAIYCYHINTSKYGGNVWEKLKDRIRDIEIIHCKHDTHDRKGILDVYKRCFIGLRFTQHDGLSNTVCELGLMGRKVIWNGNTPNAIPYSENDIDGIVENIVSVFVHRKESDYIGLAKTMKNFLNISDDFLYL